MSTVHHCALCIGFTSVGLQLFQKKTSCVPFHQAEISLLKQVVQSKVRCLTHYSKGLLHSSLHKALCTQVVIQGVLTASLKINKRTNENGCEIIHHPPEQHALFKTDTQIEYVTICLIMAARTGRIQRYTRETRL